MLHIKHSYFYISIRFYLLTQQASMAILSPALNCSTKHIILPIKYGIPLSTLCLARHVPLQSPFKLSSVVISPPVGHSTRPGDPDCAHLGDKSVATAFGNVRHRDSNTTSDRTDTDLVRIPHRRFESSLCRIALQPVTITREINSSTMQL